MEFNSIQLKDIENKHIFLANIGDVIIGTIENIYDRKLSVKLLEYSELTFTVYKLGDEHDNIFDAIDIYKRVYVEDIGWFILDQPTLIDDGETVKKECVCHSAEYEFSFKTIEKLAVNTGEAISQEWLYYGANVWKPEEHDDIEWDYYNPEIKVTLDYQKLGVFLYRKDIPELSLLDIILEKFPNWKIGYVDPSLIYEPETVGGEEIVNKNKKLIKKIDEYTGSVYSYMNETIANTYKCIFVYDCKNYIINAYRVNKVGELDTQNVLGFQTDLYLTHQNIIDSVNISANTDESCVTMIKVNGGDDVDILDVNFGSNDLYNFEYYYDQMTDDLVNRIKNWHRLRNENRPYYKQCALDANEYASKIVELTYRTPEVPANTFNTMYVAGGTYAEDKATIMYAEWVGDTSTYYSVAYNANGGMGAPSAQIKQIGIPLKLSENKPTRFGYTFSGWSTSPNGVVADYQPGGTFNVEKTTVLYAVWYVSNYYIITLNSKYGTVKKNETKEHDTDLVLPTPTDIPDGHIFAGWSVGSDKELPVYAGGGKFRENESVGLYAYFIEPNPAANKMIFNGNGYNFSQLIAKTKYADAKAKAPNITDTRRGYTFLGWSKNKDATVAELKPDEEFKPTENAVYYAVWIPNKYTIAYNYEGGTELHNKTYKTYGEPLTLQSEIPTKEHYIFVGWQPIATVENVTTKMNSVSTTAITVKLPPGFEVGEYVDNTEENTKGGYIHCSPIGGVQISPALSEFGINDLETLATIYEDSIRTFRKANDLKNPLFKEAVAAVRLIYKQLWGDYWYYKETGIDKHVPSNVGCNKNATYGFYGQILKWEEDKKKCLAEKERLFNLYDITKYFTMKEQMILYPYIIESAYEDATYVITENMTNEQVMQVQDSLYEIAEESLVKLSQPQYVVSADILNIFRLHEMDIANYYTKDYATYPKFAIGNYITIHKDRYYSYILRLIGLDFEFDNPNSLNATFSNMLKDRNGLSDLDYLLKNLQTAAISEITGTTGSVTTNTGSNGNTYNTIVNDVNLSGEGNQGYTLSKIQYDGLNKLLGGGVSSGGGTATDTVDYYISEVNKISETQFSVTSTNDEDTITNVWVITTEDNNTVYTNTTDGTKITFKGWG